MNQQLSPRQETKPWPSRKKDKLPPCCAELRRPHERPTAPGLRRGSSDRLGPGPGPRPAARAWTACGREPGGDLGGPASPMTPLGPWDWQKPHAQTLTGGTIHCHRPLTSPMQSQGSSDSSRPPPVCSLHPRSPPTVRTILHTHNPKFLTPRPRQLSPALDHTPLQEILWRSCPSSLSSVPCLLSSPSIF